MGVPGSESSILGGAAGQSGSSGFYDYQIEYSLRIDRADTSYLSGPSMSSTSPTGSS